MLRQARHLATIAMLILASAAQPSAPAYGCDNFTDTDGKIWHWPVPRDPTQFYLTDYYTNTNFPWLGEILQAADNWWRDTDGAFDGYYIYLDWAGTTTDTSVALSSHLIVAKAIPSDWWEWCDPTMSHACTRTKGNFAHQFGAYPNYHIVDADTVFNTPNFTFTTDDSSCLFGSIDVESIAMHEFGHFYGLQHSSDPAAVMYHPYTNPGCTKRHVSGHDTLSMMVLYIGGEAMVNDGAPYLFG